MNWKIINHAQFEEIACKYAQDLYNEYTWIPTKQTRDGNKDGEFEEKIDALNFVYKGWYEAKYTEKPETSIPKSHMDSTLVSGILDGSVVYILYITNGRIARDFRRRAKAILTPYRINVDFVEGDILEQWLSGKESIRNLFFIKDNQSLETKQKTIEIDDLCFFDALMSPSTLISPVSKLIVENEYYLYISIRSNIKSFVCIDINDDSIVKIPSKENKKHQLNHGFNSFFIKFYTKYPFKGDLRIDVNDSDLETHKTIPNHCCPVNRNILKFSYLIC